MIGYSREAAVRRMGEIARWQIAGRYRDCDWTAEDRNGELDPDRAD